MTIELHPDFKKFYKKRIAFDKKLVKRTVARIKLFESNPQDPALKDHKLTGKFSHLRAFWITGDIRIIYQPISTKRILFLDIGSHNQVY